MRSVYSSTVARVTMFAVLGLGAAPVAAQPLPAPAVAVSPTGKLRAERPVYRVGDQWVRTDGVYELVRIDRDVYVFAAGAGKEFHLTKDLGVTRIVLDGRTELDIESSPKFGWPLEIGKWGVGRATWRSAPPRPLVSFTGAINVSWQVELSEDLVTAAGTFRTLRITQKIETVSGSFGGGSGQLFGQFYLWYAPDVQRFVKAEGNLKGLSWELGGAARSPAPPVAVAPPPVQPRPEPTSPATSPPPVATPAPAAPPPPATKPSVPTPPSVAVAPRSDTEAPKITINYPLPDARLSEENILITGLVTDNVEVVSLQVLVNGVEATPLRDVGVMGRGILVSALAALKPGPNVIEVIATNKAGNVAQMLRTVTRVVAAPAPGPAPTSAGPRR